MLEDRKDLTIARLNYEYNKLIDEIGVTLTLTDGTKFYVKGKSSLIDYKIVLDNFMEGFFITDKNGVKVSDQALIGEVISKMSLWGISSFGKRVTLCETVTQATSDELFDTYTMF